MRTLTKCFLAVLTVTALLSPTLARTADAQVWWSKMAAGCVLDSASAAKAGVDSGFGTVGFKGAKLGRIKLTCPLSGLFISPGGPLDSVGMTISFYDTDGTGTACSVRASLLRSDLGAHEGGLDIVGFDSNTGSVVTEPGTGRSIGSVFIPEAINFGASYYWVQLELVRNSTSCNPLAVGVYVVSFIQ